MSSYLERHHAIYRGLLNSESPWEVWLKDHFRKLTWWSSFWDFAFQRGWCGFDPWSRSWNPTCLGAIEAKHKQRQYCGKFKEEFKKKKKTILICKRENLFCESELWWGKKLVNLMCGLLKTTGDLVSTPYPLLVSDTLSTSCLVPVPVFVELCCIFFQTCLQVLLSHVTFAGFYKTKSAFIKRNIKK